MDSKKLEIFDQVYSGDCSASEGSYSYNNELPISAGRSPHCSEADRRTIIENFEQFYFGQNYYKSEENIGNNRIRYYNRTEPTNQNRSFYNSVYFEALIGRSLSRDMATIFSANQA